MTDKQPEALVWAGQLELLLPFMRPAAFTASTKAIAELRRLHEVNVELVEALRLMKLEKGFVCDCGIEDPTWNLIEAIQEKIDGSH